MQNLDEDQMVMLEIQAELFELLTKHTEVMSQAVAITFKTVLDCYVAQFGREGAEKMLETAIESIKLGKHDLNPAIIPKNLLN
jgi:hypothetical protein